MKHQRCLTNKELSEKRESGDPKNHTHTHTPLPRFHLVDIEIY